MRLNVSSPLTTGLFVLSQVMTGTLWASPPTEIQPGAKVRITATQWIHDSSGDRPVAQSGGDPEEPLVGRVVAVDPDTIALLRKPAEGEILIPRRAVTRVEVSRGNTRGRSALIGAGIGAGIGLAFAAVEHSRCQGEMLCGVEFVLPVLTAPIGALVGLLTGKERWVDASATAVAFSVTPSRPGVRLAFSVAF